MSTIPCKLCGRLTPMLGTRLCNPCWELKHRVLANPELAKKIIAEADKGNNSAEQAREKNGQ